MKPPRNEDGRGGLKEQAIAAFRAAGCLVTVVRESDNPGPADLVLEWAGQRHDYFVWLELKVRAKRRREQFYFLRRHDRCFRNAFILKYWQNAYWLWPGRTILLVKEATLCSNKHFDARLILETIEIYIEENT